MGAICGTSQAPNSVYSTQRTKTDFQNTTCSHEAGRSRKVDIPTLAHGSVSPSPDSDKIGDDFVIVDKESTPEIGRQTSGHGTVRTFIVPI